MSKFQIGIVCFHHILREPVQLLCWHLITFDCVTSHKIDAKHYLTAFSYIAKKFNT